MVGHQLCGKYILRYVEEYFGDMLKNILRYVEEYFGKNVENMLN